MNDNNSQHQSIAGRNVGHVYDFNSERERERAPTISVTPLSQSMYLMRITHIHTQGIYNTHSCVYSARIARAILMPLTLALAGIQLMRAEQSLSPCALSDR